MKQETKCNLGWKKRMDDMSINLYVSISISEHDLFSMETTMLKNVQRVLDSSVPVHLKLQVFATVFEALGNKNNVTY